MQGETTVPLEQHLSLPPLLQCPWREPRDEVSPALGWLPGGMPGLPGMAKLPPLRHPALSFTPKSWQVPHTAVTERGGKKREGLYCSYKSLDGRH